MNENSSERRRRIPPVLWVWLSFFIVIILIIAIVDVWVKSPKPPLVWQATVAAVVATVSVGLWLGIRWACNRRNLGWVLIGGAALATLAAIFYLEEDWRGKRAWLQCKADLEAKGDLLDWDKYLPSTIADDQNFFTTTTNFSIRFRKARNPEETAAAQQLQWLQLPPAVSNAAPFFESTKSKAPVVANIIVSWISANAREAVTNPLVIQMNSSVAPERMRTLLEATLGRSAHGATGMNFSECQISNLVPKQISLAAEALPSLGDIAKLVPPNLTTNLGQLRVLPTFDRTVFQVVLTNAHVTAAADYLHWSDQYAPEFEEIREALKQRPYAILPGNYAVPYQIPIPNFVVLRSLAQTLSQRAQCYLLLGQPDKALREITLLHDVCRILQKPPEGKPETLVEAMINVAITGLYANAISDGLRWHAWQEPQLAALQAQLKSVNVIPCVWDAFHTEPAAVCRDFEMVPLPQLLGENSRKPPFWILMPRGWVYQNMVNLATLHHDLLRGIDPTNNLVTPRITEAAMRGIDKFFRQHYRPYTFLAAWATPNYQKAEQSTFHNQTQINEAQIACALERYRLVHQEYPESLGALAPQYMETLPHDLVQPTPGSPVQPLHYQRIESGKFLLYSIGWNERDDGGKAADDHGRGDWVWAN